MKKNSALEKMDEMNGVNAFLGLIPLLLFIDYGVNGNFYQTDLAVIDFIGIYIQGFNAR